MQEQLDDQGQDQLFDVVEAQQVAREQAAQNVVAKEGESREYDRQLAMDAD